MSVEADPRKVPGYKQRYAQERYELLLGAILDQLIKLNSSQPEAAPTAQRRARKVE